MTLLQALKDGLRYGFLCMAGIGAGTGLGLSLIMAAPAWAVSAPVSDMALDTDPDHVDLNYIGSVEFLPAQGELNASWTIQIKDAARDEVEFGLNSLLGMAIVTGDDVASMETGLDPRDPMIRRYHIGLKPAPPDRDRIVRFAYMGPLFGPNPDFPINSLNDRKIELTVDSFWFPFDMRFDSRITANLGVRLPKPSTMPADRWSAVGIDQVKRVGPNFHIRQSKPGLDIAFSLLSQSQTVMTEDYIIHDARTEPGTKIAQLSDALQECTTYLNTLAGPAGPLPNVSVVVTDRAEGAYSRGTLIALTDIENDSDIDLQKFICHERAHYWSYANAGGPENWMNEGVADYIALMAVRDTRGQDAFERFLSDYRERLKGRPLPPIWTEEATERPPYLNSYRAAPLALHDLETKIGSALFAELMQAIMTERTATTPALLALLERLSDRDTRNWFAARLAQ